MSFFSSKSTKIDAKTMVIKDLADRIAEQAQIAIKVKMPAKILRLHNMIEASDVLRNVVPIKVTEFEDADTSASAASEASGDKTEDDQTTKKRKFGVDEQDRMPMAKRMIVKPNVKIQEMGDQIKKEVLEGVELLGFIKTWVQLQIPKIEDGNNFGVAVQEEIVAELGRVEDTGFSMLDCMTAYNQQRAAFVHKMTKHPLLLDYRQAVIECDESMYSNLRRFVVEIRDAYAMTHDMLTKNLDRIIKPRNSSGNMLN